MSRVTFVQSGRVILAAVLILALVSVAVTSSEPTQVTATGSGSISGLVFQDFNSNGVMDEGGQAKATDLPVEGIMVRAFDASGVEVGSATTSAQGTYAISTSLTNGTPVRVEFTIPADNANLSGFQPSFAAPAGTAGITAGPSVQFVEIGSTDVNFAVLHPGDYCQDNPNLVSCLMLQGDAAGANAPGPFVVPTTSLVSENMVWLSNSDLPWSPTTNKGLAAQIGSVFGIGVDRSGTATTAPNAFLGTYVKRHVEYGFAGATNTIYRLTLPESGHGDLSAFVTLPGTLPAHDPTPAPGFGSERYTGDIGVYEHVGRVGLGDVDVTPDGKVLLAVDMDEQAPKLWFIPLLGFGDSVTTGALSSAPIPKPTAFNGVDCPGTWHPMGLGTRGDRILVGGVCGAENTVSPSSPQGANPTASTAFVLEYMGPRDGSGTFTTIFSMSLAYQRGCTLLEAGCSHATAAVGTTFTAMWGAWNEYPTLNLLASAGIIRASNPQAMLSNIEIADNGDLVLSLRDRFSDQWKTGTAGYTKAYEDTVTWGTPPVAYGGAEAYNFAAGEVLRVCNTATGLALESNGTCAGSDIAGSGFKDFPGQFEFYYDNFPVYNGADSSAHPETANGSSAMMPGYQGLWTTGWDMSYVGQQAIISFGQCATRFGDGPCFPTNSTTGYGSRIGGVSIPTAGFGLTYGASPSFAKGNGLADLEAVCDQAPMQIGNRVWIDTNRDGIQDPGEAAVAGVTVRLYDSSGALVGTAITDAQGQYYFSSLVEEPADGGTSPDSVGGGLRAGESYTIRLDNPQDYSPDGPLHGHYLTITDSTAADPNPMADEIDNDATLVGTGVYGEDQFPVISVAAMEPGVNDHSFDFGFSPLVAVGDKVWVDNNQNGIQDPTEGPIPGAIVTLYHPDGTPATRADGSAATTVSLADGTWVIDMLHPGDYYAVFELPQGFTFTTALAGTDSGLDSNADPTTGTTAVFTLSAEISGDMQAAPNTVSAVYINPTIDAGAIPTIPVLVGVGDRVWIDLDRDGVQDPDEMPLAGVVVTLYQADGVTPVLRIDGQPATAISDATGYWFIDMLAPGDYVAKFELPQGYVFTTPNIGDQTLDSNPDPTTGLTAVFSIFDSQSGDTTVDANPLTTATFSNLTVDVGVVPIPPILVAMGDKVWFDANLDGIQDPGELPVAGVVVTLYEPDGVTPIIRFDGTPATAITDADGKYFIDGLIPGDYRAHFTNLPYGYGFTKPSEGTDPAVDSNPVASTGMTPVFTIEASATGTTIVDSDPNTLASFVNLTIDAGIVPLVAVGDIVWFDFINSPNAGSQSLNWTQHDARYSPDEPGVAGVLVELFEADGVTPVMKADGSGEPATAITDADGRYVIDGLMPGTYRAKFHPPHGYSLVGDYGIVPRDLNSDPDQTTGLTAPFTLVAAETGVMQPNTDPSVNALFIDRTIDAGLLPAFAYGGTLWVDLNGDGIMDPGEPPLAGVTLTISSWYGPVTDANGDLVTATTGPDGRYLFEGLDFGIAGPNWWDIHGYEILIQVPDGYILTTPGSDLRTSNFQTSGISHFGANGITREWRFLDLLSTYEYSRLNDDPNVNAMYFDPNVDGGLIPYVSVGDYVWLDVNRDGLQDATDVALAGVTLTITNLDGSPVTNVKGQTVTTTTTDAQGKYLFDFLPLGQYIVTVTAPDGYEPTTPGVGDDRGVDSSTGSATSMVLNAGGQHDPTLDFGFLALLVAVGDYVWIDSDGDGLQGADEAPLPGVLVELYLADGVTPATRFDGSPATAITDSDGFYVIDGLAPGDYRAKFTLQCDCEFTATTSGSPANDSNPDPVTGMTEVFTLSLSETGNMVANTDSSIIASFIDRTVDAGIVSRPSVSVGDYVWFDVNGDGLQDETDQPLSGVTLSITNADGSAVTDVYGNQLTTTTTDANGKYSFNFLPFGTYIVTVVTPDGYLPTVAGAGDDRALDSSTGSATSVALTVDGQRDSSLDFGFIENPDPVLDDDPGSNDDLLNDDPVSNNESVAEGESVASGDSTSGGEALSGGRPSTVVGDPSYSESGSTEAQLPEVGNDLIPLLLIAVLILFVGGVFVRRQRRCISVL